MFNPFMLAISTTALLSVFNLQINFPLVSCIYALSFSVVLHIFPCIVIQTLLYIHVNLPYSIILMWIPSIFGASSPLRISQFIYHISSTKTWPLVHTSAENRRWASAHSCENFVFSSCIFKVQKYFSYTEMEYKDDSIDLNYMTIQKIYLLNFS